MTNFSLMGWISHKLFSLRVLVPLLFVPTFMIVLGIVYQQQMAREADEVYREYQTRQMDIAGDMQASIERDMRTGLWQPVQQHFSGLSLRPEVLVGLLVDEHDKVIASTRLSLIGNTLHQAVQKFSAQDWLYQFPEGKADEMLIQQAVYRERNAILIFAPVRLNTSDTGLVRGHIGKLLIYTDVTVPLAEHAVHIRLQITRLAIGLAGGALLVAFLLHWVVTRRLLKLLRAAERVSNDKLNTVSRVSGPDEIGRLGTVFDSMVQKMAQSSAQIRKLSRAVEQSPNSIIITNEKGIIEYVNPHFCKVSGYAPEEVIGKTMRMHQSGVTPKEVYDDLWQTIKSGKVWRGELLNKNKQGRMYWEDLSISPIFDEQGKITNFVSEQIEITARKLADEQVRLFEKVFANANEAILISDADNKIINVNPAFTEVTGYTREEVIGKNPRIFSSGLMDEKFYQEMWQALNTDGKWQGEVVDRRKDGEIYAEWLSISSLRDDKGRLTHYIALVTDISERKAAEERMNYLAQHDALTGMPNRILFQDRLQQAIAQAERQQCNVALLFMDLDRFKNVNDMLGHHAGDLLLQEVARRIRLCVRSSDTISRQGGDEFVIMLPNLDDLSDIVQVLDKLIESIASPYKLDNHSMHVTTSIGVSVYPQDGSNSETLLKNADMAMYQAKEAGRNSYRFFTQEMNNAIAKRIGLENKLRTALAKNELLLYYQPKVDLHSGEIVAAEALVRWQHPEDGLISPADFIPIAEESGMIVQLGKWVLNEACRQNQVWRKMGLREIVMAVNLSPLQFHDRDLINIIQSALLHSGMPAGALELEVTESATMKDPEQAVVVLNNISKSGVRISIDDFGTGYSSLSHLKRFPIDELKVDQSFVRDISVDMDDAAIVSAVIAMAKSLGLTVIAEGVETLEQVLFLKSLDCDKMQGFFFSMPLPADEFRMLIESGRKLNISPGVR